MSGGIEVGAGPPTHVGSGSLDVTIVAIAAIATLLYGAGVSGARAKGRPWPRARTASWVGGVTLATASIVGPVASMAHDSVAFHSVTHLAAGMAAPLLLVVAAPVTLALRAGDPRSTRRLVAVLRSMPVRLLAHPVTASALMVAGLWLLYRSPQRGWLLAGEPMVHFFTHGHLLASGYLFLAAIVGRDPNPHRASFPVRAILLVLTAAFHAYALKWLYAHPPSGLPVDEVRESAVIMYYGGGAIEVVIMALLWAQWYHRARPRQSVPVSNAAPSPTSLRAALSSVGSAG